MKKVIFILSFIFVGSLGMSTFAATTISNTDISELMIDIDKKECKKGCTCDTCTKKAKECEAKKANCKTECAAKKSECSSKSAETKCCSKKEGEKAKATEKKK